MRRKSFVAGLVTALMLPALASGERVPVRDVEGVVHGFLVLRQPDGTVLASGDLIQTARGNRVTARLVFRFKDGSLHDETAVFTQRGRFALVTDRLVQTGPAFDRPIDMTIDVPRGRVTVRYKDDNGEQKIEDEQLSLPDDVSNGLLITLLKNLRSGDLPAKVSFVAATPKPRLIKLAISQAGADRFSFGPRAALVTRYVIKVEIGGLTGLLAPLVGKQPPDIHMWVLEGEAPAFVRSEGPLFLGGPPWRIDLTGPSPSQQDPPRHGKE